MRIITPERRPGHRSIRSSSCSTTTSVCTRPWTIAAPPSTRHKCHESQLAAPTIWGEAQAIDCKRFEFSSVARLFDLAVEQEMLGRDAQQLGKAAMEVERAKMDLLGDLAERWAAMEFVLHEAQRGNEPRDFAVGLKVVGPQRAPLIGIWLEVEED